MNEECLPIVDNYPLELRHWDQTLLRKIQADPAFDYQENIPDISFLDRFLEHLLEWLRELLPRAAGESTETIISGLAQVIKYGFPLLVAVCIVMWLLRADFSFLFFRKTKKASIDHEVLNENIHELNFADEIHEAIDKRLYRKAIRLYYLQSLKNLDDKGMIAWQRNKTNRDYQTELQKTTLSAPFAKITWLFDYIWYGEFALNQTDFETAQSQFIAFNGQLKS